MLDNLNKHPSPDGQREQPARPSADNLVVGDREVPINVTSPFDAMHRWLDGEAGESEARRDSDSARYVDLWRRLGAEAGHRRREAAPADMAARVMSAIPNGVGETASPASSMTSFAAPSAMRDAPVARIATVVESSAAATAGTRWQRPLELNPTTAIAAAAGLVALGLAMGAALRGN